MSKRLLMLLVVIGIIWGGCSMGGGKAKEVQEGMQKYLQDTYGMEFVVDKPYMYGNEGTGYIYQAKAYPKGKPELEFFVEGDTFNTGVYIDGYLQVKWTYQGRQEIEQRIRKVYGEDVDYVLDFTFRYNNKKFKNLDYAEVIANCNGSATVDISYDVFMDRPFDKSYEAARAFEVFEPYILKQLPDKYMFNVLYFTSDFKSEYMSRPVDDRYGDLDLLHEKGELLNFLRIFCLKEMRPVDIKNNQDLVKYYQY